jgi:hypothetical protein
LFDGIKLLTSANQPTFPKARDFVEQCSSLLDANGLLPAARLELSRIPKLAPYMCLLGVIGEGEDFEVRLAGTRLVDEFLGANPTGAKLSQVLKDDEFGRRSWHIMGKVLRTKQPVLNQPGRTRLKSKEYMRLETVNYPLVDASGRVIKVACLYDYLFEKQAVAI